jgi:hypothetical protein
MTEIHTVQPSNELYRWLHPGQFDWKESRPTSAAFTDPHMSVDIAVLTDVKQSYLRGKRNGKNAVVSFQASIALEREQEVIHCPTHVLTNQTETSVCSFRTDCPAFSDESVNATICINDAHGCVIGNKTRSVARAFAKASKVEIWPPSPS